MTFCRSLPHFFIVAGCLLAAAMAASELSAADRDTATRVSRPTNVLFIVVDDLRPELGCYGASQIRSPHIDALARRGTTFLRAYCQQAVCNPSRASVLSGCRPDTTQVMDNQSFLRPMMPQVVTLPEHFKNHGYTALSVGKVFHHSEREPGDDPLSWSEPAWYHAETTRQWFNPASKQFLERLKALPPGERPKLIRAQPFEAADEPDASYQDGQIAAKAIATLERLNNGPFFLAVGFHRPHLPFNCPQKYWDLYPAETIHLPANYHPPRDVPAAALHDLYELRSYGGVPPQGPISDDLALALNRGYRACVSFVDAQIGLLLAALERLDLAKNTIVVLWGDHGYHLGENGLFTKMTNFEWGTRSPLIVALPGQTAGGRQTSALVELVDIYPTLAELCELPQPGHLEGTSFAPLLAQPERAWKTAVFSQYLRPGKGKQPSAMGRSIRTVQWRYTEWRQEGDRLVGTELYDHHTDPGENINLAADPNYATVAAEMAQRLAAAWRRAKPR